MSNVIWQPQPKQKIFMSRPEDEALYGGAAGGGKSDALVIEATRQVHIPYYKGLILRKTYPQLTELIEKSQLYYPRAFPRAKYNEGKHTWTFPSGAKIVFGSLQHSKNKLDYQGKAFDFIGFDELTHFTYDEYIYLISRNRPNGDGTRCYMRATANPGGIGHSWVKDRWITSAPPMTTIWEENEVVNPAGKITKVKRSRIFVPSSVFDNEVLLQNDPSYVGRLASMPEAEKKALLYGDWDSYSGQYFSEFRNDVTHYQDRKWTHVIDPFEIPSTWTCYRSFDWGYAHPYSMQYTFFNEDGQGFLALDLYGCTNTPNTGVRETPDQVFRKVREFEDSHRWLKNRKILGVADPSIWNAQYGESIADTASKYGIYFQKGDNERLAGWMQCRYRLQFDDNGIPMFYVFNTCKDFIRTIPSLIHDEHNVEDLESKISEDHEADAWRYCMMCRKILPRVELPPDNYVNNPMWYALEITKDQLMSYHRNGERMEIIDE